MLPRVVSLVVARIDSSSIVAMHEPLDLLWVLGAIETPTLEAYNAVGLAPRTGSTGKLSPLPGVLLACIYLGIMVKPLPLIKIKVVY